MFLTPAAISALLEQSVLSLSPCRTHPPFGVNSRKDIQVEMLMRYGWTERKYERQLITGPSEAQRSTHTSEITALWH